MEKKKIGILRGGIGKNYFSSLKKGGDIIFHLYKNLSDKYKVVDILIDKNGVWHINGMPTKPGELIRKVDTIWNVSDHSSSSVILNNLSIPNISEGYFLKTLENNNDLLRSYLKKTGIKIPNSIILSSYQEDFDESIKRYAIKKAKEVFGKISPPWIVKSFTEDSDIEIYLAKTFLELVNMIEDRVVAKKNILIEEFITEKIITVHSISGFYGEDVYVLPSKDFKNEKEKIISLIKNLHKHLGVKYYLKTDLVIHPRKGYFLKALEFSPDFKKESNFTQTCENIGLNINYITEYFLKKTI